MYQPAEKSTYHRNNDFGMVVDGHQIILEAWDVPGDLPGDETHPLNRSFFDSALICFSVDNVQNVNKAPRVSHPGSPQGVIRADYGAKVGELAPVLPRGRHSAVSRWVEE